MHYTHTQAAGVKPRLLVEEIIAAGLPKPHGVRPDGDDVQVHYDAELTAQQQTDLAAVVAAHDADVRTVEEAPIMRILDAECTLRVRRATFSYGGNEFSMSDAAQRKWLLLHVAQGSLTYPVTVRTADDRTAVSLPDAAAVEE